MGVITIKKIGILIAFLALFIFPLTAKAGGGECTQTGFYRDGINLTALVINPTIPISNNINATGCNIGVYFGPGHSGIIDGATIHGANYYGVVNNQADVTVKNSTIYGIGENPLNGSQHGVGIYYANVSIGNPGVGLQPSCDLNGSTTGEIHKNSIYNYQKGGIVVNCSNTTASVVGNIVEGEGQVNWIAQNGIQISRGATASVVNNEVTGNWYTPSSWTSTGILIYGSSNVKVVNNKLDHNQVGIDVESDPLYEAKDNKIIRNIITNYELASYIEDGMGNKVHANVQ